jgi:hypothetical protein
MAKKSKKYIIDGEQYVFIFNDAGNLEGISKPSGRNGQYKENAVDPNSDEFARVAASEDALNAYNVNRFKGKGESGQITKASVEELNKVYDQNTKKNNNQDIDLPLNQSNNIATNREENYGIENPFTGYNNAKKGKVVQSTVFAYPLDIDPQQDHLKIKKYKYQRTSVSAGRPGKVQTTKGKEIKKLTRRGSRGTGKYEPDTTTNVAGDSVLGMEQLGSVILPMPKVVDTNGAEWGESKINILGLAAIGSFSKLGKLGVSKEEQERLKGLGKELKGKGRTSSFKDVLGAIGGATFTQEASTAVGQQISTNEFLARASGRVLNPNAELLFQGPVLRDFNFDFLMIARSREEGDEIRRIIRWFKTGMAPRFNNATFLETPDVFSLEYKRGQGPMDQLDTVNRFNPGGLALRTIAVDYAPNGYWSAYQDSQPVAVRMSLNFAELRPIFASDQEKTPAGSVGY